MNWPVVPYENNLCVCCESEWIYRKKDDALKDTGHSFYNIQYAYS